MNVRSSQVCEAFDIPLGTLNTWALGLSLTPTEKGSQRRFSDDDLLKLAIMTKLRNILAPSVAMHLAQVTTAMHLAQVTKSPSDCIYDGVTITIDVAAIWREARKKLQAAGIYGH